MDKKLALGVIFLAIALVSLSGCLETLYHSTCQAGQCVQVAGAGVDACELDEDCQPKHLECRDQQCVIVDGIGMDQCQKDADCIPPMFCEADSDCNAGKICCAHACVQPACSADTECDDLSPCTTDECSNAGTCSASCSNIAIELCCGNGICEAGEDEFNCPADCPECSDPYGYC